MNIALTNDYHRTTVTLRPAQGRISARAWHRAMRRLCGVAGCTCGGVRGEQTWDGAIELQDQGDGSRRAVAIREAA